MADIIKVLLTVKNNENGNHLGDVLNQKGMKVEFCPENGAELLRRMDEFKPDIIIMDAFMQHIDGMGVLTRINKMNPVKRPLVFVLSCVDNHNFQKNFLKEGADYCFVKPVEDQLIAERIGQILSWSGVGVFADCYTSQELSIEINRILYQAGVTAKIKGFKYLREAIILMVENPELINNVTQKLYPALAQVFNTTPQAVERALRYAIGYAWDTGNIEIFRSYFGYSERMLKKPTNSEFIARIADDLRFKRKMHTEPNGMYKSGNII